MTQHETRHGYSGDAQGAIRIGIGGWTYAPWRGAFYPDKWPHRRELEYASRHVTSIEINGTYYGSQKPASFAKWRDETPDGFVFSLKAPRFVMNRGVLAGAGESIQRFLDSGILELQDKLGPINWQFMPSKQFERADFAAFLKLLPKDLAGRELRHAVEVRHESFRCEEFLALLHGRGVAVVVAGDSVHPQMADVTAPFVYARIMGTQKTEELGYAEPTLDRWALRARGWATGALPQDLAYVRPQRRGEPRDVYLYVIGGNKVSNPAAAMSLAERLERRGGTRNTK